MSAADRLAARAVDVLPPGELATKLALGRPLRVKLGVDPTAPDIHLGHTVVLGKLREFQDAGHPAVLVIGDWTARVGDPSGRTSTRPVLERRRDRAQRRHLPRAGLPDPRPRADGDPPQRGVVRGHGPRGRVPLTGSATVNQLLRRNDFAERIAADRPMSVLELLYPLMQAYDSVQLRADVEIGGTDQLFNLMLAREIQPAYGQPPQVVLTMPLLSGLDGEKKMSKSLGNHVGVADPAEEQFGRTMRIPDALLHEWYRLLAPDADPPAGHPAEDKRRLARLIADRFHGAGAGEAPRPTSTASSATARRPRRCRRSPCPAGTVHLRRSWRSPSGSRPAARRAGSSPAGASASTASRSATSTWTPPPSTDGCSERGNAASRA